MIDVALAIDEFSVTVVRKTNGPGAYGSGGKWVDGEEASEEIQMTVQPIKGSELRDLPEGLREEAQEVGWTRSDIDENDRIENDGETYRVLHKWKRRLGGFNRVLLGEL